MSSVGAPVRRVRRRATSGAHSDLDEIGQTRKSSRNPQKTTLNALKSGCETPAYPHRMSPSTFKDAQLLLAMYDLRRKPTLRLARKWFAASFHPITTEELAPLCPAGSEQEASFRMVYSYWEMASSFVTAGVLNEDLFVHNSSELLFVWKKFGLWYRNGESPGTIP